tara:strand:+ start:215 stop:1150 length:936 start_codon:yes stop_codon:yes gene_type:complete
MSLTHFIGYDVKAFTQLHNKMYTNASQPTITSFRTGLGRIEKLYAQKLEHLHLKFLDNPEGFWLILKNSKYSKTTQISTLTTLLKLLRILDAPLRIYNQFQKIKNREIDAMNEERLQDFEDQAKDMPNYDEMRDLSSAVAEKFLTEDMSYTEFRNFLILNLFLLQIPTRSTAYINMYSLKDKEGKDDNYNYLIKNRYGYTFEFNKYKTFNAIKKKKMPVVNPLLVKLLDRYFKDYYIEGKGNWFLKLQSGVEMRNKDINNAVKMMSEIVFDKELGVENIRHAYLEHQIIADPDLVDKMEIAQIMGYKNIPN